MSDLTTLNKRRGVALASITCLANRLKELESDTDKPTTLNLAQGMLQKLETLDNDFRTHRNTLVDLIDDEGTLSSEQGMLDGQRNSLLAYVALSLPASSPRVAHCGVTERRRYIYTHTPDIRSTITLLVHVHKW